MLAGKLCSRSRSNPLVKCSSIPSICSLAFNRALMSEDLEDQNAGDAFLPVRKPKQGHRANLAGGGGESSPGFIG